MNTGAKATGIIMFYGEIVDIIYDARWLLAAITLCVAADFWYGWSESRKRYARAKAKGDKVVMSQYRWRPSRAWRRTFNKLSDYLMWVILGTVIGYALLHPLGLDHTLGGVTAAAVAILCEANSFCSHFFYLHGVRIERKTVGGFVKAFIVAFAKRKDADIGEALEDALEATPDPSKDEAVKPHNRKTS